jgi:TonB family protein
VPLPGLFAFASLNLGARTVPIVASVVLHAGIAAGLVVSAGGHARPGLAPTVEMTIDVDTLEPMVAPTPIPEPPPVPEAQTLKNVAAPTHTHPYPVDPSHDARPHDPSQPHDHDHHDDDHDDHDHAEAAPVQAAPALVAEAALPRFDLGSGSGSPLNGRVAGQAATDALRGGAGTSVGNAAAPGSDEIVHAASAVQVPARLVQSAAPVYPGHARADDVEGDVGVEIVVDREGRVVEARVTRSAGHGFDAAALTAVRAYRFSPAQREGRTVRVRMPWSVQFRLR